MKLSPIVDHGYLLGLGDDDHPQYLHLNKAAQTLQQNLAVTDGKTIDGIDISAHAANASAHHARYTDAEALAAVQANGLNLSGKLVLTTVNPYIGWYDTDGALNEKDARMHWYEGGLLFRSHNDDGSVKLNLLAIAHNGNIGVASGATIDGVDISAHAANVNAHINNLTDIPTRNHSALQNIGANDHHAQAHTLASHSTKAHSELTGVTASQHHVKYTNAEAVAAVSAGDLTKLVVETNTLVADGGKVGIGTGSPDKRLVIYGKETNSTLGEGVDCVLKLINNEADVFGRLREIHFGLGLGSGQKYLMAVIASAYRTWHATNGVGGDLIFGTKNSTVGGVVLERMRIDQDGKVEIKSGTITHQGAILKSGIQTEGRCHAGLSPFMALAGNQVTVCFREKLTNTPSSVTLSNVPTTDENNMEAGYPQAMRVSKWSFGFFIRAAAMGDANSCDKKFVTVGN